MPHNVKFQIDTTTLTALHANLLPIRFLLRAKFDPASRHSADILPCAQTTTEKATRAMLKSINRETAPHIQEVVQLNAVRLLRDRPYALICFDLFPPDTDEQAREEFSLAVRQPIHEIIKRGGTFHVVRSRRMDDMVAGQYGRMREVDKGPRPYFADSLRPPVYVDGVRIERSRDREAYLDELVI